MQSPSAALLLSNLRPWLVSAISLGVGAFLGAYLKKKGENVATHEDLEQLVEQMKAVTLAAKEIETNLSEKAWDRQRRWELKRDIVFQVSKQAFTAKDKALKLRRYYRPKYAIEAEFEGYPPGPASQTILANAWKAAYEDLYSSIVIVNLTCGKNLAEEVNSFSAAINDAGCGVLVEGEDVNKAFVYVANQYDLVVELLRNELESGCLPTP